MYSTESNMTQQTIIFRTAAPQVQLNVIQQQQITFITVRPRWLKAKWNRDTATSSYSTTITWMVMSTNETPKEKREPPFVSTTSSSPLSIDSLIAFQPSHRHNHQSATNPTKNGRNVPYYQAPQTPLSLSSDYFSALCWLLLLLLLFSITEQRSHRRADASFVPSVSQSCALQYGHQPSNRPTTDLRPRNPFILNYIRCCLL